MERTQHVGTVFDRILRSAGWLLVALVLLAVGDAALAMLRSGWYVLDVLLASLLWPLGLMMAIRRWPPLFRILRVFFGVLAAYALTAVTLGLLGYGDLVGALYLWPTTSPIHLLPGGLQALAVLVAGWSNQRIEQTRAHGS
jgi:hypothetical protein